MKYAILPGVLGDMLLTADGPALTGLYFEGQKHQPAVLPEWVRDDEDRVLRRAAAALSAYFSGASLDVSLPLQARGTAFQQSVWAQLRAIPRGQTLTYAEVARAIGAPAAVRAVGAAVGRNPISLFVPCHRVLGSDGSLTGYAGGLSRKAHLLRLEGVLPPELPGTR